jgi:hypothetical protein
VTFTHRDCENPWTSCHYNRSFNHKILRSYRTLKLLQFCKILTMVYDTKTLITNKCTKRVLSSIVTHSLHVSTLLGHLQGELFVIITLRLHFYSWVRMCCWLCTALFWEARTLCGPDLHRSTQSTAHSHSTIKCNLSVTITKKVLPEDDPAGPKHVGMCYDWW